MSTDKVLLILFWIFKAWGLFVALLVIAAGFASVLQERKIWNRHSKLPSINAFGLIKVFLLNVTWMGTSVISSLLTVVYCVLTLDFWDQRRRIAHTVMERNAAKLCCHLFVAPIEIRGAEHLPPDNTDKNPAPVLVANHDSQIDIAAVYSLNRQWRWIAKSSVVFLPGVGQIMWLSGHVFIDRLPKKKKKDGSTKQSFAGARNLYIQSNKSVQNGVPMFFFPQGTRRLGERLPFKDGAFKVAKENDSQLVPISIEIPLTAWNSSYPFGKTNPVVITVHPPIESKDQDLETLKKQCFDTIYSVLPDYTKQS